MHQFSTARLGRVARIRSGDAISKAGMADDGVPVFGANGQMGYAPQPNFPQGALCVGRVGSCGAVNHHKYPVFISDNALVVRPTRDSVATSFLEYVFRATNFAPLINQGAMPLLTGGDLADLRVPLPESHIQTAIADFLDCKTAAIDTLIAKKEELIRELDAYRQALITETVSKGLNPDVAVRQSGVAGLGEIPAHWQVVKTGKVLRYIKGKAVPKEDLALEGGASQRFWRTGDFWNLNNREKDEVFVTNSTGLVWKNEDELVICFDGFNSEIGKGTVGMARFEGEGYIDSHLELITPRSTQVHKRFLEYVHCTSWMESAIVRWARGAIAYSAGYAKYELQLPLPPLPEQEAIAAHLDARLAGFRRTREIASKQIAMLKEYRASLISEAVTGKLAIK